MRVINSVLLGMTILRGIAIVCSGGAIVTAMPSITAAAEYEEVLALYKAGDHPAALGQFRALAGEEDPRAFFMLGRMYQLGHGVEPDDGQAAVWYREAGHRGHTQAQSILGFLYRHGVGVAVDQVEAYVWFALAAENGHEISKTNRDNVERWLDADRRTEAMALLASRQDMIAAVEFGRIAPAAGSTRHEPEAQVEALEALPLPLSQAESTAYSVQIGSFANIDNPPKAWKGVVSAHPDLVAGLQAWIKEVDRGDEGALYLLRVGPFASHDAAQSLCGDFKAQDFDCFVADP